MKSLCLPSSLCLGSDQRGLRDSEEVFYESLMAETKVSHPAQLAPSPALPKATHGLVHREVFSLLHLV